MKDLQNTTKVSHDTIRFVSFPLAADSSLHHVQCRMCVSVRYLDYQCSCSLVPAVLCVLSIVAWHVTEWQLRAPPLAREPPTIKYQFECPCRTLMCNQSRR